MMNLRRFLCLLKINKKNSLKNLLKARHFYKTCHFLKHTGRCFLFQKLKIHEIERHEELLSLIQKNIYLNVMVCQTVQIL